MFIFCVCQKNIKIIIDNLLSMLYSLSTRILIFDIDFCTLDEVGVCEL